MERDEIRLLVAMEARMFGEALCAYLALIPNPHIVITRVSTKAQTLGQLSEGPPTLAVIEHPLGGDSAVEIAAELHERASVRSVVVCDENVQDFSAVKGTPGVIAVVSLKDPIEVLGAAIRGATSGSAPSSVQALREKRNQHRPG